MIVNALTAWQRSKGVAMCSFMMILRYRAKVALEEWRQRQMWRGESDELLTVMDGGRDLSGSRCDVTAENSEEPIRTPNGIVLSLSLGFLTIILIFSYYPFH
jgi:hypothetical protein